MNRTTSKMYQYKLCTPWTVYCSVVSSCMRPILDAVQLFCYCNDSPNRPGREVMWTCLGQSCHKNRVHKLENKFESRVAFLFADKKPFAENKTLRKTAESVRERFCLSFQSANISRIRVQRKVIFPSVKCGILSTFFRWRVYSYFAL